MQPQYNKIKQTDHISTFEMRYLDDKLQYRTKRPLFNHDGTFFGFSDWSPWTTVPRKEFKTF